MRVLLDECVPRGLRRELPDHEVKTVAEMGWAGVKNGALLRLAEKDFDVFLTVDRGLEHQQDLSGTTLAVILLRAPSNDIVVLRPLLPAVREALDKAKPGTVVHVHG
jgi:predicted nuclease of predicted toxin-antitoxin system